MAARKDHRRGVIDTSVLVAGIAGFESSRLVKNPSSTVLREWLEGNTFVWLVTEEILAEYKEVLMRLGVRRNLVGAIVNLLREEAESWKFAYKPPYRRIQATNLFVRAPSRDTLHFWRP